MRSCQVRVVFALLAMCLLVGAGAPPAEAHPSCQPHFRHFIQPFLITFNRHDAHVVAFITGHPEYETVEAMVDRRDGGPPLIRAILTRHEGSQIDFFNDETIARERAAALSNRLTLYRPIQYEESRHEGLPMVRMRFTSHQGEEVVLSFHSLFPPLSAVGGLINPGEHSGGASLPVMWAEAGAFVRPTDVVRIDGVSYPLAPGPLPDSLFGIYTEGFLIGVIRQGSLRLWQLRSPRRLAVGEKWLYWDNLGNLHDYEIIGMDGDLLTLHKTTTSSFLSEEVITVRRVGEGLQLRSVRVTGRVGRQDTPPPASGFILELPGDGRFSLSIDTRADLVTGPASQRVHGATPTWTLQPREPSWATRRPVRASVSRQGRWFTLENRIGEE
jgi:hypothetical protein